MMTQQLYFDLHIFGCTNRRPDGHERGSCAAGGAEELVPYLKARLKELSLQYPEKIASHRVNKSGCLDRCELGPVLVIYPQGIWYHYATKQDLEEILQSHILQGQIVTRLCLKPEQKTLSE